jgi:hypothetical protein
LLDEIRLPFLTGDGCVECSFAAAAQWSSRGSKINKLDLNVFLKFDLQSTKIGANQGNLELAHVPEPVWKSPVARWGQRAQSSLKNVCELVAKIIERRCHPKVP